MSTILVVDDTASFREPVAATLRRRGHHVVCADCGRRALKMLAESEPDLILLDLAMPEMDGLAFLRAVRQQPRWQALPVILLTAMMEETCLRHAEELGVQNHMIKSHFSLTELATMVSKCLNGPGIPQTPLAQAG